jgi:two-component system, OmpR family, response regulator
MLVRENPSMRVLIVEDELRMASLIRRGLVSEGLAADLASSGEEALWMAPAHDYDAVVLDVMLPDLDGFEVCRRLRGAGVWSPVLMLTARDSVEDRVAGLDSGADDYLVKPFAFAELLARVNALARRPPPQEVRTEAAVGDLKIDFLRRAVSRDGRRIDLQPKEYQLLEYLMRNAGRIVTRTMLLESVWEFHFDPKTNIVETHMSRLRSKIDRGHARELIHTVRGAGYVLREPD